MGARLARDYSAKVLHPRLVCSDEWQYQSTAHSSTSMDAAKRSFPLLADDLCSYQYRQ